MLYFKNIELAKKYHVSLGTVRNWIEAAQTGKLDLDLHTTDDKTYIANTAKNVAVITKTVEARRKYRNKIGAKIIEPKAEFYALFNKEQVYDIVSNLEIHHEIPRQYNYFDGGATRWKKYAERLAAEEAPNMLTSTVKLLHINADYIDNLLAGHSRINVIDVGAGDAYPAKALLAHLLEMGKLGRYIALDISPTMLEIAKNNIETWFGDTVTFEGHEYDVNYDRFSKLLTNEYMQKDAKETVNLVLLFGGTLSNMRYPDNGFKMIHDSMGLNDVLVHTTKLDTEMSRTYFDFNAEPGNTALSPNHRLIFDLFNIDETLYDVEMGYDAPTRQRYIRVRLKVAVTIRFTPQDGKREVSLNKGDTILLWRFTQHTAQSVLEQFDKNDFYPLHTSQTDDHEYLLTVSRVKTN